MDRQTRKANFKKLQEAAGINKQRTTRSTAALSLSTFFDTIEKGKNEEPGEDKKLTNNHIFEPPGPKPKRAPKLASAATRSRKKQQQPRISDFLRNEQIFSEVAAQHSMADNFSPDDIEMALALSKSEAEKHGRLRLTEDGEEEVVNLVKPDNPAESTEKIRRKLQKYGFRTAAKEDYNPLTFAALPGLNGRRGKRCKWANKFTPLTLRNPEVQLQKLETKVANLLAQGAVRTKELTEKELRQPPYELISSRLKQYKVRPKASIIKEPTESPLLDVEAYYVKDLIEVNYTPSDHLLKDWAAIQGRDLSPKRLTTKNRKRLEQLEKVYAELEKHFGNEQQELDELEKMVVEQMIEVEEPKLCESPLKEPPDKRVKISEKENMLPKAVTSSSTLSLPTQKIRCTSPDLFADSDDDDEMEEMAKATPSINSETSDVKNFSLKVYRNLSINEEANNITSYEVFSSSSDEVKTVIDAMPEKISVKEHSPESFIDLTEEEEDVLPKHNLTISCQEPDIFMEFPGIESDSDMDNLNCTLALDNQTSQPPPCTISNELYKKYAPKPSSILELESSNNSLNFSLKSVSNTSSLNLSQWNNSGSSFHKSFSFQTEPSFKTPLSRKSNSFMERSHSDVSIDLTQAGPSPLTASHSDVSLDLTQTGDDENEGILLSDDEINYSIWKANKSTIVHEKELSEDSSDGSYAPRAITKKRSHIPHFKTAEDLDNYLASNTNFLSPNKSVLSKERAEFGILDAALSQPFTLSELQSPSKDIDWSSASFLDAPAKPLKRKSSHKFNELFSEITESANSQEDEFDEFDRLIFQNHKDAPASTEAMPEGLDLLLQGEIQMEALPSPEKTSSLADKLEVNGNVYHVKECQSPKPDFTKLTEAELLQRLYNFGIKPLKRKQAVKMLEFIYNQTHPILQPPKELPKEKQPLYRSKSTPVPQSSSTNSPTPTNQASKLSLSDASGAELLRFSQSQPSSLCDDFEFFVLQTNVTKKTPQPLLPLHIAWHNLLCANPKLHESVLMYEPIDLQEIYLHLKQMGQRYDPKDLKSFFDRRCIIFRYELNAPGKQAERHVRKNRTQKSRKRL